MRNSFINRLTELAEDDSRIFVICGDLGYSVLEPFARKFPDRFLNIGIAEQNMLQVATGLSFEGYNVFTYSIGNFPTLRCMEQIRYDVCYHKANVKIVAVGAGYAYGPLGVSHHTTEDIAMLRALPGMVVTAPGDPIEAVALADWLSQHTGPGYIRLNKTGEPHVHSSPIKMDPGSLIEVTQGKECAVLCCGSVLPLIAKEMEDNALPWALYSAPFVAPMNPTGLMQLANQFESLVTVEEHQLSGGFGSAVIEIFSDLYESGAISRMPPVRRVGIRNRFISVAGSQEYLRAQSQITLSGTFQKKQRDN